MAGGTTLVDRGAHDGPPPLRPSGGRNGGGNEPPGPGDASRAVLGMYLALVPILVLFLTMVTAYVLRRATHGPGAWAPLPGLVWLNTVLLLASSVALERGRKALRRDHPALRRFAAAFSLGILFLLGQLVAWLVWWKSGMGPGATPHSAFFYILTGTHGVHVLGGVFLLGVITWRHDRPLVGLRPTLLARLAGIYWHFLAILWLGLLALLQLWR